MTVKELKEVISGLPDDYEVRYYDPEEAEAVWLYEVKIVPSQREVLLRN